MNLRIRRKEDLLLLYLPATKTCEGESRPFERREPRNHTLGRCIHQTAECSKRIQDGRYLQSFKELEEQGHTVRIIQPLNDYQRKCLCPVTKEID